MLSFKFYHGCGDVSNAAHLFHLWTKRGEKIQVECSPEKSPLFLAGGCEIVKKAERTHHWPHPPKPANKTWWNLLQWFMPKIGEPQELWKELRHTRLNLKNLVLEAHKRKVDSLLKGLPEPFVVLHTQGNTNKESKDFPAGLERNLVQHFLDETNLSVVLLDWDNRTPTFNNWRVRDGRSSKNLNLPELWELMSRAAVVIGVDSGPLHFARFTDTPRMGVWFHHHPAHFALPDENSAHLMESGNPLTRHVREEFNIVETHTITPEAIVKNAIRMMSMKPKEVCARGVADRCRYDQWQPHRLDREISFNLFYDNLKKFKNPIVVETGSIRSEEDFTAGFFGYHCGLFLKAKEGYLHTLELDSGKAEFARKWTKDLPVTTHVTDSRHWLRDCVDMEFAGAYLDSADIYEPGYAECCLEEFKLVEKHLLPGAFVLIDDTSYNGVAWEGKGKLAVPYFKAKGWRIVYSGHQTMMVRG